MGGTFKDSDKLNMIVVGFDSEYVRRGDTNEILSYQYAIKTETALFSGIFYPARPKLWTLNELIAEIIQAGRENGILDRKWPDDVYLVVHFSRADIGMLEDFATISRELDALRGTYATLSRPLKRNLYDHSKNKHVVKVHVRDTMTIAPGGTSLAAIGELLGIEKVTLPAGAISAMDKLLEADKPLFEKYAIRDAEIAAEFAWKLAEFSEQEGLGFSIPITLGSVAVKLVEALWGGNDIARLALLGKEVVTETKFKGGRYRTEKNEVFVPAVYETEALATECYHGGRNEAYTFGPTDFDDGFMTDIDLSGAYSTAMAAIRMPNWGGLRHTTDLQEFKKERLGLARVAFKFPEDCLYPCLPVRTDKNHGLIFPLEGVSYCASPEIELALEMGADVVVLSGVIVPWASEIRPFELFSKKVRAKRSEYEKGHVFERTWKEIGNSLYGKVAQGLRKKRVFDSRTDETKTLPPSKVTQPFLAAYITSIVRATLGELLARIPDNKVNISATTDGFITNATLSELDTSGPLCSFFSEQAMRLTGEQKILEVKHVAPQVVCMKTRGQLTVGYLGDSLKPIKAKAGVQTPKDDIAREDTELAQFENDWMLDLFVSRTPDTTVSAQQLTSMREMHLHDKDMVMEEREKRLNLEFDWKRELIEPEMVLIGRVIGGENPYHIALKSKPHKTIEDFTDARSSFDEWRKTNALKTMADWDNWREFERRKSLKASGEVTGHGKLVDQCKRQFLKDFAYNVRGMNDGTYKQLADWLSERGYPTYAAAAPHLGSA